MPTFCNSTEKKNCVLIYFTYTKTCEACHYLRRRSTSNKTERSPLFGNRFQVLCCPCASAKVRVLLLCHAIARMILADRWAIIGQRWRWTATAAATTSNNVSDNQQQHQRQPTTISAPAIPSRSKGNRIRSRNTTTTIIFMRQKLQPFESLFN